MRSYRQAGNGARSDSMRLRNLVPLPALPLAFSLGPVEVKLGLALGLVALLVALELGATAALAALGLAGRGRARRFRSALALALPLLVIAPRLEGPELLAPTHPLRQTPGVPDLGAGAWDLLSDAVFQFLPWEHEVRRAWSEGHPPFWSDTLQSSPWSNPQAQVLSPVALLARCFPFEHFLLAALAIKLLLAVDGAWALAAATGARWPFRALAAVSFAAGGGMLAWAVFPHSSALALVPWLVAAAIALARRGGPRRFAVAALAAAALALGGHPEVAVAGGLLAALAALAYRRRRAPLLPALARLAGAAGLGLALAAPHVLPFYLETRESQRFAELVAAPVPRAEGIWTQVTGWFPGAHLAYLRSPLGPEVFGRPFFGTFTGPFNWVGAESGYAGLAALAGAAVALTAAAARRRALPFALFAGFALLAAARFEPLVATLARIPGARAMAIERLLLPGTLALAVAGALGAQALARRPRRALWIAFAAAAAASLGAAATPRTLAAWLLLAAAAAAAPRRRTLAALALVAALVVDLGLFARDLVPAGFTRQLYPASPLLAELARRAGDEPFRVAALGTEAYPATLAPAGLEDLRVHDPLADQRYLDLTGAAFDFHPTTSLYFAPFARPERRFADFLGLRFLLARPVDDAPVGWEPIRAPAEPGWVAYENPRAAPRVFLPAAVVVAARAELPERAAALDDGRTVVVAAEQAPPWLVAGVQPSGEDRIRLVARRNGRLELDLRLAASRAVATSLLEWEGWRAAADGRALETLPLFGAFLGFRAPAGESRVVLAYRPPGFSAGAAISAAAGALLLGAALAPRRRRS